MNKVKVDSWEAALDELADERRLLLNTLANIIELWDLQVIDSGWPMPSPNPSVDAAVNAAKMVIINLNKKDA